MTNRYRPRFFVDLPGASLVAPGMPVSLSPEDSRHARRVLRLQPGDECEVVIERRSEVFLATVLAAMPEAVTLKLEEPLYIPAGELRVLLVQALSLPGKIDLVIEKGTEVGVDAFLLVKTEGSPVGAGERLLLRKERWRRIAREASKQSRQLQVPVLEEAVSVDEAWANVQQEGWISLILEPSSSESLRDYLANSTPVMRLALWVGPEGGWSGGELERFRGWGLPLLRLGRRILRTETAGPVAAALVRFARGDW